MVHKLASKEIEPAWQTFPLHFPGGQIEQASEKTSAPGESKKNWEKWEGGKGGREGVGKKRGRGGVGR